MGLSMAEGGFFMQDQNQNPNPNQNGEQQYQAAGQQYQQPYQGYQQPGQGYQQANQYQNPNQGYNPYGQQPPYGQPPYGQPPYGQQKSKLVAGLLGIFLGGFGVHNFYLGFTARAIIQIVVSLVTCGIGAWWGIIEGILILCGRYTTVDANGVPLGQ